MAVKYTKTMGKKRNNKTNSKKRNPQVPKVIDHEEFKFKRPQAVTAAITNESTNNDIKMEISSFTPENWQKTNWIKTYFVEIIPVLSLSLFLLALIYDIAYYSVFNINFIPYISFSELLFFIIDPMVSITYFLLVFTFISLILLNSWMDVNEEMIINKKKEEVKTTLLPLRLESFIVLVILAASYKLFILLFSYDSGVKNVDYGFFHATLGLTIPFFIFFIFFAVICILDSIFRFKHSLIRSMATYLLNISAKRKFGYALFFYLYAILVFYLSGAKSGNFYLTQSPVSFEIMASDKSIYDNSEYTYIGHTNNRIFLRNKKCCTNIILNSDNTAYIKISSKGEDSFIIAHFLNSILKEEIQGNP